MCSGVKVAGFSALCVALTTNARAAHAAESSGVYLRGYLSGGLLRTDTKPGHSSGPGVATQFDLGGRLSTPLRLHASLILDHSPAQTVTTTSAFGGTYSTTIGGLGLGLTYNAERYTLTTVLGAQGTSFPPPGEQHEGNNASSPGPFLSLAAGRYWGLGDAGHVGLHLLGRYAMAKDETNGGVYDPKSYFLGLGVFIGFDDSDS